MEGYIKNLKTAELSHSTLKIIFKEAIPQCKGEIDWTWVSTARKLMKNSNKNRKFYRNILSYLLICSKKISKFILNSSKKCIKSNDVEKMNEFMKKFAGYMKPKVDVKTPRIFIDIVANYIDFMAVYCREKNSEETTNSVYEILSLCFDDSIEEVLDSLLGAATIIVQKHRKPLLYISLIRKILSLYSLSCNNSAEVVLKMSLIAKIWLKLLPQKQAISGSGEVYKKLKMSANFFTWCEDNLTGITPGVNSSKSLLKQLKISICLKALYPHLNDGALKTSQEASQQNEGAEGSTNVDAQTEKKKKKSNKNVNIEENSATPDLKISGQSTNIDFPTQGDIEGKTNKLKKKNKKKLKHEMENNEEFNEQLEYNIMLENKAEINLENNQSSVKELEDSSLNELKVKKKNKKAKKVEQSEVIEESNLETEEKLKIKKKKIKHNEESIIDTEECVLENNKKIKKEKNTNTVKESIDNVLESDKKKSKKVKVDQKEENLDLEENMIERERKKLKTKQKKGADQNEESISENKETKLKTKKKEVDQKEKSIIDFEENMLESGKKKKLKKKKKNSEHEESIVTFEENTVESNEKKKHKKKNTDPCEESIIDMEENAFKSDKKKELKKKKKTSKLEESIIETEESISESDHKKLKTKNTTDLKEECVIDHVESILESSLPLKTKKKKKKVDQNTTKDSEISYLADLESNSKMLPTKKKVDQEIESVDMNESELNESKLSKKKKNKNKNKENCDLSLSNKSNIFSTEETSNKESEIVQMSVTESETKHKKKPKKEKLISDLSISQNMEDNEIILKDSKNKNKININNLESSIDMVTQDISKTRNVKKTIKSVSNDSFNTSFSETNKSFDMSFKEEILDLKKISPNNLTNKNKKISHLDLNTSEINKSFNITFIEEELDLKDISPFKKVKKVKNEDFKATEHDRSFDISFKEESLEINPESKSKKKKIKKDKTLNSTLVEKVSNADSFVIEDINSSEEISFSKQTPKKTKIKSVSTTPQEGTTKTCLTPTGSASKIKTKKQSSTAKSQTKILERSLIFEAEDTNTGEITKVLATPLNSPAPDLRIKTNHIFTAEPQDSKVCNVHLKKKLNLPEIKVVSFGSDSSDDAQFLNIPSITVTKVKDENTVEKSEAGNKVKTLIKDALPETKKEIFVKKSKNDHPSPDKLQAIESNPICKVEESKNLLQPSKVKNSTQITEEMVSDSDSDIAILDEKTVVNIEGKDSDSTDNETIDEADGSDGDIVPCDEEHGMFTVEETQQYHKEILQKQRYEIDHEHVQLKEEVEDETNIVTSNIELTPEKSTKHQLKNPGTPDPVSSMLNSLYKKKTSSDEFDSTRKADQNKITEEDGLNIIFQTIVNDTGKVNSIVGLKERMEEKTDTDKTVSKHDGSKTETGSEKDKINKDSDMNKTDSESDRNKTDLESDKVEADSNSDKNKTDTEKKKTSEKEKTKTGSETDKSDIIIDIEKDDCQTMQLATGCDIEEDENPVLSQDNDIENDEQGNCDTEKFEQDCISISDNIQYKSDEDSINTANAEYTNYCEPFRSSNSSLEIVLNEDNSPDCRVNKSPVKANVENSPLKANLDKSPVKANVENSPLKANVEKSPLKANVDKSPLKTNVEKSPIKASVDNYPLKVVNQSLVTSTKNKSSIKLDEKMDLPKSENINSTCDDSNSDCDSDVTEVFMCENTQKQNKRKNARKVSISDDEKEFSDLSTELFLSSPEVSNSWSPTRNEISLKKSKSVNKSSQLNEKDSAIESNTDKSVLANNNIDSIKVKNVEISDLATFIREIRNKSLNGENLDTTSPIKIDTTIYSSGKKDLNTSLFQESVNQGPNISSLASSPGRKVLENQANGNSQNLLSKESPANSSAKESPATLPAKKSPATLPAKKSPANLPAKESPANSPGKESPANSPAKESPANSPAKESPANSPAKESPANSLAMESPANSPAKESSANSPAKESPANSPAKASTANSPAKESPANSPAKESPANSPAKESPANSPAKESPANSPAKESTANSPAKESPANSPANVSPTNSLAKDSPAKVTPKKLSPSKDITTTMESSQTLNMENKSSPIIESKIRSKTPVRGNRVSNVNHSLHFEESKNSEENSSPKQASKSSSLNMESLSTSVKKESRKRHSLEKIMDSSSGKIVNEDNAISSPSKEDCISQNPPNTQKDQSSSKIIDDSSAHKNGSISPIEEINIDSLAKEHDSLIKEFKEKSLSIEGKEYRFNINGSSPISLPMKVVQSPSIRSSNKHSPVKEIELSTSPAKESGTISSTKETGLKSSKKLKVTNPIPSRDIIETYANDKESESISPIKANRTRSTRLSLSQQNENCIKSTADSISEKNKIRMEDACKASPVKKDTRAQDGLETKPNVAPSSKKLLNKNISQDSDAIGSSTVETEEDFELVLFSSLSDSQEFEIISPKSTVDKECSVVTNVTSDSELPISRGNIRSPKKYIPEEQDESPRKKLRKDSLTEPTSPVVKTGRRRSTETSPIVKTGRRKSTEASSPLIKTGRRRSKSNSSVEGDSNINSAKRLKTLDIDLDQNVKENESPKMSTNHQTNTDEIKTGLKATDKSKVLSPRSKNIMNKNVSVIISPIKTRLSVKESDTNSPIILTRRNKELRKLITPPREVNKSQTKTEKMEESTTLIEEPNSALKLTKNKIAAQALESPRRSSRISMITAKKDIDSPVKTPVKGQTPSKRLSSSFNPLQVSSPRRRRSMTPVIENTLQVNSPRKRRSMTPLIENNPSDLMDKDSSTDSEKTITTEISTDSASSVEFVKITRRKSESFANISTQNIPIRTTRSRSRRTSMTETDPTSKKCNTLEKIPEAKDDVQLVSDATSPKNSSSNKLSLRSKK